MNKQTLLVLAAVSLVLTACGGSDDDAAPVPAPPSNTAPQISGLADQSIDQDTSTGDLAFSVSDAQSGAGPIDVTAVSSNTDLIPPEAIVLGGSGASRSIALTPAEDATGSTTITVTATDPDGASSTSTFNVVVREVQASLTAFALEAFAKGETELPLEVRGRTFVQDADDPTTFDGLLQ